MLYGKLLTSEILRYINHFTAGLVLGWLTVCGRINHLGM